MIGPASIHAKLDEALEGIKTIPKLVNVMLDLLSEMKQLKAKTEELEKIVHEKVIMDKEQKIVGPDEEPMAPAPRFPPAVPPSPPYSPSPYPGGTVMYGPPVVTDGTTGPWTDTSSSVFCKAESALHEIKSRISSDT